MTINQLTSTGDTPVKVPADCPWCLHQESLMTVDPDGRLADFECLAEECGRAWVASAPARTSNAGTGEAE